MTEALTFADIVRRCRDDLGLTQHEFADKLGVVNQSAVAKWELGRIHGAPRADRIRALSEVCRVSPGALLASTGYAAAPEYTREAITHAEDPDRAALHDAVDGLTPRQVRALLSVVREMTRQP